MTSEDPNKSWADRIDRERRSRRQAEQLAEQGMRELWVAKQTLEQKVRERTIELNRSLAALEHSERVRGRLLEDLGHRLATPLRTIAASLEFIDTRYLPEADRLRIAEAQTSGRQLDSLLQAIFAVANVRMNEIGDRIEERRPIEVLDELEARWQLSAARRGLLMVCSFEGDNDGLRLDWHRLIVAVEAIIDSSVSFAEPGPLKINLSVLPTEVRVGVEDSGPALADLLQDNLAPTSLAWAVVGRRGIGLAVAQRVADESLARLELTSSTLGGIRSTMIVDRPTT